MIKRTFTFEGKRYYIRGKTEKEVFEKMALRKRDLEEGRALVRGSMTVSEWTARALEAYKPNISSDYRQQMEQRIGKHILSQIGGLPIKSVRPLQCQEILNRQQGMSRSHIKKLKNELFFIFDKARLNKLIADNPAAGLTLPDGYEHKRRSLTTNERKHWLNVMDSDPRFILYQLMYYCGCRPMEAARVMRTDFHIYDGYPRLHIRGTKTANSDRYVPVPPELWTKVKDRSGLIATTVHGCQHTPTTLHGTAEALRRAMNIDMGCQVFRNALVPPYPLAADFVPYFFRHTYCSDLQKKGVDIRTAKDLMGHADIRTTANIYTHQDDSTMREAAKKLGAL